jgi:TnsA endonuclease-like protein
MGRSSGAGGSDPEFELCYLEAGGAERCELPASWPGLRPEAFAQVRGFRWARGQQHLPGLWWSVTNGSHVGYESWLERDHVMLLDFDPEVTAIAAQPFWLRWRDEAGRPRRHVPDLFARMADGSAVVIDVRPDDRIEPRDAEAFDATRSACELAGWGFRRVGVADPVRVANVAWLARYRHQRCGSPDVARLLLKAFAESAPLMAGACAVGDPMAVLPALFHLMWQHALVADLAVRLTAETLVSVGTVPGGTG